MVVKIETQPGEWTKLNLWWNFANQVSAWSVQEFSIIWMYNTNYCSFCSLKYYIKISPILYRFRLCIPIETLVVLLLYCWLNNWTILIMFGSYWLFKITIVVTYTYVTHFWTSRFICKVIINSAIAGMAQKRDFPFPFNYQSYPISLYPGFTQRCPNMSIKNWSNTLPFFENTTLTNETNTFRRCFNDTLEICICNEVEKVSNEKQEKLDSNENMEESMT